MRRNILYAPDYAVNAGGVINIGCEIGQEYDAEKARLLTMKIEETVAGIFRRAEQKGLPTNVVANAMAEEFVETQTVRIANA